MPLAFSTVMAPSWAYKKYVTCFISTHLGLSKSSLFSFAFLTSSGDSHFMVSSVLVIPHMVILVPLSSTTPATLLPNMLISKLARSAPVASAISFLVSVQPNLF